MRERPGRFILTVLLTVLGSMVPTSAAEYSRAAVATDHAAASEAGLQILQQGGNVVDAAVASSFALSVVRPASCGVGGGGFMLIWNVDSQQAIALDYRETAPDAAARDMFAASPAGEAESVRGGKAVAVPGTVSGLCFAAEHYGSLPLATLLAPAVRLAKEGVAIDEHDLAVQRSVLKPFQQHPEYGKQYASLLHLYLNDGIPWKPGDRFHSPQLPLLQLIADHGSAAFHSGDVADAIVETVRRNGGVLSARDLQTFTPKIRQPVSGAFRQATLYSMPPPSSGGIALIQTLQTLDQWEQRTQFSVAGLKHNSPDYVHVVSEAMKHAFADRSRFLGDADFVDVPQKQLLSVDHARQTAATIHMAKVREPDRYGRWFNGDDAGTSHVSVIDAGGNAVSCTETINLAFGSFVVVPEYGIVLNNEMDDFSARPGEPNAFGLLQSEANSIAPGKKPLSSMTPTIAVRDGRAVLATGASGGPRIISATLQVILNHLLFDMPPEQAVSAPRFHHQWHPCLLHLERGFPKSLQDAVKRKGHELRQITAAGVNQSVSRRGSRLRAASDPRKHGQPAGF